MIRKSRFPHPTSAPSGHLLPEEGGSIHASPFPWKGLPSAARRGWLPFSAAKPPPRLPPWERRCVEKSGILVSLPSPLGKGDRVAVDRVLSYIVDLRCISPLIFHPARTLSGSLCSPPSPRGEGFVRRYSFSTYACICFDNARKAVFSFRSLPYWGRGTASAAFGCSR